jgi:NADH:ubiquinone oxidoreductase subunit 5 (subunit L)/multisubunit Na+/H+ antiporter MnhA subunit
MIINRIGDFGLALALFAIYAVFQSLDYPIVFSLVSAYSEQVISVFGVDLNILDLIGFFLFIGAVGKSAQVGLHT